MCRSLGDRLRISSRPIPPTEIGMVPPGGVVRVTELIVERPLILLVLWSQSIKVDVIN